MATVSTTNSTINVTAVNTQAAAYASEAKTYAEKAQTYASLAEQYAEYVSDGSGSAVSQVKTAATEALTEIETAKENAVTDIATYNLLAKEWAVSDDLVDDEDYSAKYYAEISKTNCESAVSSAQSSAEVLNTVTEISSNAETYAGTAADCANEAKNWANYTEATVDGEEYSDKYYAEQAAETVEGFNTDVSDIIDEVKTAGTVAATDIETASTEALSNISTAQETAISAIETAIEDFSLANASETEAGVAMIAATEDMNTGTDDTKIVTPLKCNEYVASQGFATTSELETAIQAIEENNANISLSNLSDEGINKLEVQKMYETGNVLTDEQGYNQLVEMASSTYDSSKFTIVGEPTITEDGIASGFSSSNSIYTYINIPNTFQTLTIRGKAVVDGIGVTTSTQVFHSFDNSCRSHISPDGTSITCFSGNNFSHTLYGFTLQNGDEIELKLCFDNTSYTNTIILTVNGKSTYTSTSTYTAETAPTDAILYRTTYLGNDYFWYGTIDLKTIKIIIDGEEVFNGAQTGVDTVEIDGESVEIPYTLSSTGSKIVDVAYRDKVQALYEQDGQALYYTLDTDNQNFTLPMGEVYGMIDTLQTNIDSINSSMDGMWTAKSLTILDTEEFTANYSTKFDLSNYLPNDGNIYEVVVNSYGNTTNKAYSVLGLAVNGGLFSRMVYKAETHTTSVMYGVGSVIIPVTSSRQLTISSTGGVNTNTIRVYLAGYRKVR